MGRRDVPEDGELLKFDLLASGGAAVVVIDHKRRVDTSGVQTSTHVVRVSGEGEVSGVRIKRT